MLAQLLSYLINRGIVLWYVGFQLHSPLPLPLDADESPTSPVWQCFYYWAWYVHPRRRCYSVAYAFLVLLGYTEWVCVFRDSTYADWDVCVPICSTKR